MQVVDPLEWPVGCSSAGVVGQDLFSPGDDLVHNVVVFGDLAAVVEVGEPVTGPAALDERFSLAVAYHRVRRQPVGG